MKKFKNMMENNWAAYTLATCSAVLLFSFLTNFSSFYNISVIFAVLVFVALLVLFFLALIPSLAESISSLAANMGSYVDSSQELLAELDQLAAKFRIDITEITDSISEALNSVMGNVPALLNRILSASVNMGSAIFNIGIGFILAVYFLMGKSGILRAIEKLRRAALTAETYERHTTFLARCHKILIRYIGCNIFDAMIIGMINAVFMLLTGMEYIALISLVVGVTNLLPTFGPIIGGAIGAFILVLIDPMHALIFIVFTLVLQTFDGYILKPKLFGESLGVSAVVILITIILGGKIFGVIGILRSPEDGDISHGGETETHKKEKEVPGAGAADVPDAAQNLSETERHP